MFNKKKKKKKLNLIPRLLVLSFIIIACTQTVSALFLASSPELAFADGFLDKYTLQTQIGEKPDVEFKDYTTRPIAEYIEVIYKYAIGIVGIVAAVVLMIGGVIWLTAGGNTTKVGEAKAWIGASLTGLVLVLTSYMILSQINPNLTEFKPTPIMQISGEGNSLGGADSFGQAKDIGNCTWLNGRLQDPTKCPMTGDFTKNYKDNICGEKTDEKKLCCCIPINKTDIKTGPGGQCPDKLWPSHCAKCNNCIDFEKLVDKNIIGKNKNIVKKGVEGYLNEAFANKLADFFNKRNYDDPAVHVTETWPPTVKHNDSRHYIGECIDLNITVKHSKENVQNVYDAIEAEGMNAVYECQGAGCCAGVGLQAKTGECWEDKNNHITAAHFSVYK